MNAPKNLRNSFGGYNYRSCEGILEAVKPLLAETGCTLTLSDEVLPIGSRIYVCATASLRNAAGEVLDVKAYAREEETKKGMDAAQVTGAASSYARKYALNGLFAIDDAKDPDTDEYQKQQGGADDKPARTKAYLAQNVQAWQYYQKLYNSHATLDEFTSPELLWIYQDLTKKGVKI